MGARHNGKSAAHHDEYIAWHAARRRCNVPQHEQYARYGGRGIRVCAEWDHRDGFLNFLGHIGPKPFPEAQLDRINNDGNYEPGNVRWVSVGENQRNRRSNVRVTHNGQTRTLSEWAREAGISRGVMSMRYRRNWPVERLLGPPDKARGTGVNTAKVEEADVVAIRAMALAGEATKDIAVSFGVSVGLVRDIVNRKTWRHVA